MNGILLTVSSIPIIGQVAWLLGKIMEGIFNVLDVLNIPNVGLAIILFTIIVNLLMLPLTVKQQKFSKLSAKMNPELQAIQAKYKGKKDNDSMMAQNQEMQNLYAKYGVSPTGSCMYLLIQMPILLALYRVIDSMPAYVKKIRMAFDPLVNEILSIDSATGGKATEFIQNLKNSMRYSSQFGNSKYDLKNTLIDCLNKASTTDFKNLAAEFAEKFPSFPDIVSSTVEKLDTYNNFLGLNIGNSPWYIIKENYNSIVSGGFTAGALLLILGALAIPVLSVLTQWVNIKLMPQPQSVDSKENEQAATMAQSMKTMNMVMPLFSAYLCFSFPCGMGIYWVAGSVVRSIQQVAVNRHLDRMDFEDIIRKNTEKNAKKLEKMRAQQEKIAAYANMNTKNVQDEIQKNLEEKRRRMDMSGKVNLPSAGNEADPVEDNIEYTNDFYENADPDSFMAKANLVRKYSNKK